MSWPLEDERMLLADAAHHSLRVFIKYAFGVHNDPESRLKWDEVVHGSMADWLDVRIKAWEEMRRRVRAGTMEAERHYLLIDAMRGGLKTCCVTKGLNLWIQLRNPNTSAIIDSVQQEFSIELASVIRGIYENKDQYALFTWLYGMWAHPDVWTKDRFNHAGRTVTRSESSFECCSVETGITGKHPDVHTLDDPVTLEKLRESGNWIKTAKRHVQSIFPALLNDSLFILVATPYQDNDVVTSAIREEGIKEVHGLPLPPEYRDFVRPEGKWYMYHMPCEDSEGRPTLPSCWPKKEILNYMDMAPAEAAAQIFLRPGSGGTQTLTFDQIQEMIIDEDLVPERLPLSIHLDTAFKSSKRIASGDDNVIEVWGHLPGMGIVYFLEAIWSNKWNADEFIDQFVNLVSRLRRRHRILGVTDETIIGGKHGLWKPRLVAACQDAGFRLPRFFELNRGNTAKVSRITDAASYWAGGYVRLRRSAPGLQKLMWQMARIGVSDHDDFADCGADVFHPEIYRISNAGSSGNAPVPRRPMDEYLKTGRCAVRGALDHYDAFERGEFQ